MLGLILVYDEVHVDGQAVAPDRDFLGAPVLARSLIAAIPSETEVKAVVAVADKFIERVQTDVIRRFGFIEVAKLLPWTGDLASVLSQSLDIFGNECTQILLHDGRRPLLTQEHVKNILQASNESGAAVSVLEPQGPQLVIDSEGRPHSAAQKSLQVLHPQALSRKRLENLLQNSEKLGRDLNLLPVLENSDLATLPTDPDNLRIVDERDLSRAVEVWSRRAVEFPFLWPRPERFDAQKREQEAQAEQEKQEAAANSDSDNTSQEPQDPANQQQSETQDTDGDVQKTGSDAMNAMLSGDNADETAPLETAFASADTLQEDANED